MLAQLYRSLCVGLVCFFGVSSELKAQEIGLLSDPALSFGALDSLDFLEYLNTIGFEEIDIGACPADFDCAHISTAWKIENFPDVIAFAASAHDAHSFGFYIFSENTPENSWTIDLDGAGFKFELIKFDEGLDDPDCFDGIFNRLVSIKSGRKRMILQSRVKEQRCEHGTMSDEFMGGVVGILENRISIYQFTELESGKK